MSARIVCDRLIIPELPFKLDPYLIVNALAPEKHCGQATFVSSVTVRYTPNVSSETPGQTVLAVSTRGLNSVREAHAAACKVISPIWKGSSLVIPRDLLRFEDWSRNAQPSLWLSCVNVQGTVDISCTIKCAVQFKLPTTPTITDRITSLNTQCYLGPVLAGFSLIGSMPHIESGAWVGKGNVINIDLKNGTGKTTSTLYIRTPEKRNYVAVRYGIGSANYVYTTANKNYSWKSYTSVVNDYTSADPASGSANVAYTGSWRPIKGSTSWWAEVHTLTYSTVSNGVATTRYHPCAQLILYYEYPGLDIFSPDFTPTIRVHPGDLLPCPSGNMSPNKEQKLPLNQSRLQMAWNVAWNPVLTSSPLLVELFESAKKEFTAWPVNCGNVSSRRMSSGTNECDEGQDKSDDAEYHGEPGTTIIDHSV